MTDQLSKEEETMGTEKIPNPGSKEAIKSGCLCPVMDNRHGHGVSRGMWQKEAKLKEGIMTEAEQELIEKIAEELDSIRLDLLQPF